MMKKPGMSVSTPRRQRRRPLTELNQGIEASPRTNNILPLDLLVIEEPPDILVSGNVADVGPTDVEGCERSESGNVCAERLQKC